MSAKITGGGSLMDSGVADVFAKALFGDPEREMKLALGRSDLATDEYTRRLLSAREASEAESMRARREETNSRMGSIPAAAQLAYDNLPAPVPVAIPTPAARPPDSAFTPGSDMSDGSFDGPAPVDPNYGPATATGDWLPPGTPTPPQQLMPGDMPPDTRPSIQQIEALMGAGAWTNDPLGQFGKGAGEVGIVYGDGTPEEQARNNLLYAGKTPGETAGAQGELIRNLRKDFAASPAFQEWATINTGYENMLSAMKTLTDLPEGDMRRGPADMRMIYSYLKMLDPNTGVKEGEYASAREAGGQYAGLWNLYDRVVSGAVLDQGTRQAFLQEAFGMHEIATNKLKPLVEQYTREAQIGKFDPNRIIQAMPTHERPEGDVLPSGVTDEMVNAMIQQALPEVITRQEALRLILNNRQAGAGGH